MMIDPEDRAEYKIEEAVLVNYQKLGYSSIYPPVRRVLLSRGAGVVDLVLLPKESRHRLVLIEAKHAINAESGEKVVGQLLKYYSYALTIGIKGLDRLRNFAENESVLAHSTTKITFQRICGRLHRDDALPLMQEGRCLRSNEIRLFVAVDGKVEPSLLLIASTLREHHNLDIGVIQVLDNTITVL
jgi:hypothetical protein